MGVWRQKKGRAVVIGSACNLQFSQGAVDHSPNNAGEDLCVAAQSHHCKEAGNEPRYTVRVKWKVKVLLAFVVATTIDAAC